MDTLYFDVVRSLYHLALAVLVGGGLVLGAATAPAIFATVRSRGEAGSIFGAVLARWDGLAILCVIVLVITSALMAGVEITGAPEARLVARWVALAVLAASVLYASGWASPVARSIRAQTPAWDDLPESAPVRLEFAKMHRASSGAMRVGILAGLVAMFLS
ncbi:MAG TPA: DUF4149 domain-containing protein [Candidatus Limnocylindria bacterium]|nr:DUF4149 domain-containing protein [Candidatus Limnocylindria bacterium]